MVVQVYMRMALGVSPAADMWRRRQDRHQKEAVDWTAAVNRERADLEGSGSEMT